MSELRVDLRSDTLTRPTAAMKEAIAAAALGDDCYGEDPTVNQLQDLAAAKVGTEAALFMPTGTMANTCALLAHTDRGDEIIVEDRAHLYNWESGAFANVAGLAVRALPSTDGILRSEQLDAAVRPENPHYPACSLVCIENTHNNHAGIAWTPAQVEVLATECRRRGLRLHIDGARIFNAAVARGVEVGAFVRHADSVTFCISKGLSAPVGSLLCGSRAFVEKAYRMRKRLGGAMRQAGIIAAAGIVALESMVDRLAEDHRNALRLATHLATLPGVEVEYPSDGGTNILMVDFARLGWTSATLIDAWRARGIRCNPRPPTRVRLLTHRHISSVDVDYVVAETSRLIMEQS